MNHGNGAAPWASDARGRVSATRKFVRMGRVGTGAQACGPVINIGFLAIRAAEAGKATLTQAVRRAASGADKIPRIPHRDSLTDATL